MTLILHAITFYDYCNYMLCFDLVLLNYQLLVLPHSANKPKIYLRC